MCPTTDSCPRAYMSIHIQIDLPDPCDSHNRHQVTAKLIAGSELIRLATMREQFEGHLAAEQLAEWVQTMLSEALAGDGLCDPFRA